MPRKSWMLAPKRATSKSAPEQVKSFLKSQADDFVASKLKPLHVREDNASREFNYIIDISTRWRGSYFYFCATYQCVGTGCISPTFETKFARMEHAGGNRFNLSYMRHTGKWIELFQGMSVDEALQEILDQPYFCP